MVAVDDVRQAVEHLEHDLPPGLVERLLADVRAQPGADRMTTIAPFTGKPLFDLPVSTEQDVADAVVEAREAQQAWAARPVRERAAIIGRIHNVTWDRRHELLDLLQLETGRSRFDAYLEAASAAVKARYLSRTAPSVLAPSRRLGVLPFATKPQVFYQPVGVVGLITAWNFPVVFASADGFAALVAGNGVVHRPDRQSLVSTLWVRSLAIEAGVPPELWQVLNGPGAVMGPAIVGSVDYVAFTGSTRVGREIAEMAAPRLIRVSLELGGKNSLVLLPDAPVRRAAYGAIRATFTNAGQACVGSERVLVPESLHDQFVTELRRRMRLMRLSTGFRFGYEMGSLVNQSQLEKVSAHVEDAVAKGAVVLEGGRARPDLGPYFYEPTLLTNVRPGMMCVDEETFGPVLSVSTYHSLDEAVEMANDTAYGLHASVWSRDTKAAEAFARRLRVGTVEINDGYIATWGSVDTPQGGMKESGIGRRNGPEGILRFTEPQSVTVQRAPLLHPPPGVTQQQFADIMAHTFKALHLAGRR